MMLAAAARRLECQPALAVDRHGIDGLHPTAHEDMGRGNDGSKQHVKSIENG
jgi:hypothetical protein